MARGNVNEDVQGRNLLYSIHNAAIVALDVQQTESTQCKDMWTRRLEATALRWNQTPQAREGFVPIRSADSTSICVFILFAIAANRTTNSFCSRVLSSRLILVSPSIFVVADYIRNLSDKCSDFQRSTAAAAATQARIQELPLGGHPLFLFPFLPLLLPFLSLPVPSLFSPFLPFPSPPLLSPRSRTP